MSDIKWNEFLIPYAQAVDELKIKFRNLRKEFLEKNEHSPIEFVTGRVKTVDSIKEKMRRRFITEDLLEQDMQDIAGIRIQCQFVEDIYDVAKLLHIREDMRVIEERDYIANSKPSGYRSYHVVIEYPIQTAHGQISILAEIQIRTLAMNFWATIEHSLNYKYQGKFPDEIEARLRRAAEAAFQLDTEMSSINGDIKEAQQIFSQKKGYTDSSLDDIDN